MNHSMAFYRKINHYLLPYKGRLILIFLLSVITSGLNLLPLQIMATFIDILTRTPKKNLSILWIRLIGNKPLSYIFIFAIVYLSSSFIMQLYAYLVSTLGYRICEDLRTDAFYWSLKAPKTDLDSLKEGDIVARVITDTDQVSEAIVIPLRGLVVSFLELIWALILLYTWSPILSLVTFIIVPILYYLGKWGYLRSKRLAHTKQMSIGNLTDIVSVNLRFRSPAKLYPKAIDRVEHFKNLNRQATWAGVKLSSFYLSYWPLVKLVNALGLTLTIYVAYYLFLKLQLAPEDIMVAYLYSLRVYEPILDFTRFNMMISSADAALGRVLELQSVKNI